MSEDLLKLQAEIGGLASSIAQITQNQGHLSEILESKLESIRNEVSFASRSQTQSLELVKFMVENHIDDYNKFRDRDFNSVTNKVISLEESKNKIYGFAMALSVLGSTIGSGIGKLL